MKINKIQMKKWIEALRSGEYNQTQRTLQDELGYCCLGVACKVLIPKEDLNLNMNIMTGASPIEQGASPMWLVKVDVDFQNKTGRYLVTLNDRDKMKFTEIADLLEMVYILEVLK